MARKRKRERNGGIEVRTRDVTDGVDHHHDHKSEDDCDSDMAERVRLVVDHDRAGAGKHECKRPDQLGDQVRALAAAFEVDE